MFKNKIILFIIVSSILLSYENSFALNFFKDDLDNDSKIRYKSKIEELDKKLIEKDKWRNITTLESRLNRLNIKSTNNNKNALNLFNSVSNIEKFIRTLENINDSLTLNPYSSTMILFDQDDGLLQSIEIGFSDVNYKDNSLIVSRKLYDKYARDIDEVSYDGYIPQLYLNTKDKYKDKNGKINKYNIQYNIINTMLLTDNILKSNDKNLEYDIKNNKLSEDQLLEKVCNNIINDIFMITKFNINNNKNRYVVYNHDILNKINKNLKNTKSISKMDYKMILNLLSYGYKNNINTKINGLVRYSELKMNNNLKCYLWNFKYNGRDTILIYIF